MNAAKNAKEVQWHAALDQIVTLLDQLSIAYFLDTGTLLGAKREGRFIPWDNDIDIAILGRNHDDRSIAAFAHECEAMGAVVNMSMSGLGIFTVDNVEVNLKYYEDRDDMFVADFSFFSCKFPILSFLYNVAAGIQFRGYGKQRKQRVKNLAITAIQPFKSLLSKSIQPFMEHRSLHSKVPQNIIIPLGSVSLYGTSYAAPGNTEKYLEARYGLGWNVPQQNYNYLTDDQSFVVGSNPN